ncbi:hypothetical protein pb186bvf_008100 [Paramecium bursaria]
MKQSNNYNPNKKRKKQYQKKNYVPGIVYLYTCFTDTSEGGARNLYCYTNIIEISMALVLLGLGIYIIVRRYRLHIDNVRLSRKQLIVGTMVLNLIGSYLVYQWSYGSPLLYFPEYYFQYLFFCITIYYFGRKSIMLGMINMRMDVASQDMDPIVQLKISKLFCVGLCSFFTIIFIMNYIQYYVVTHNNETYSLCRAKFFNVVTTVGFFMQGLFILQVKQLSRQVEKNLTAYKLEQALEDAKKIIQQRQKELWVLVIVCFIGSFTSFSQNIFFVTQNIKNKYSSNYDCQYVNVRLLIFYFSTNKLENQVVSNDINALIGTAIKFVDFFLPYFLSVKIFWVIEIKHENTQDQPETMDTYEIRFRNQTSTDRIKELTTELV